MFFFTSLPTLAVVDGTPVPDSDHRLDGVGLLLTVQPWNPCGGWVSGTCTLVAPNMVLLARHSVQGADFSLPPSNGQSHRVRFRRSASGGSDGHFSGNSQACDGQFQEIFIRDFVGCPAFGIDMVLGFLATPAVGITPLAVDVTFEPTSAHQIMLAGWGYDGRCVQSGDAWTLRSDTGVLPPARWVSPCCFEYNATNFLGTCLTWPANANWVKGNLHDSGAPLLVEHPNPSQPSRPHLRVVGLVTTYTSAQRVSIWNTSGGLPTLGGTQGPPPPLCLAEFDGVEGIAETDLLAYMTAWLAGDSRAEMTGQPGITLSDLLVYLDHYLAGC